MRQSELKQSEACSSKDIPTDLDQREQHTLEERRRLIQRLLQRLIQLVVELPSILRHVVPHSLQQDALQEDGRLSGLEVGDKDLGGCEGGVRGPRGWGGEGEETGPLGEGWEKLEGFGEGTGSVTRKEVANPEGSDVSYTETLSIGFDRKRSVRRGELRKGGRLTWCKP
jgi:hypothetical protein